MGGASSIPLIGGLFNSPLDDYNPPAQTGDIPYFQGYQNVFQQGARGAGSVPAPQLGFSPGFAPNYGGAPYAQGMGGMQPQGMQPGGASPSAPMNFGDMFQRAGSLAGAQSMIAGMPGVRPMAARPPQIGGITPPTPGAQPPDPFQSGQMQLMGQLQDRASGGGPSVAQNQLQQATDQNIAQAYAMGSALQGNNQAGAAREVAYQRAGIQQQAANQSAQLRAQEQISAQQQLSSMLGGARGQDIGVASENAQLSMQQQQLNDQMVRFYLGSGMSLAEAQQAATLSYQQLLYQKAAGQSGVNASAMQTNSAVLGAMLGAGSTMATGGNK